MACPCGRPKYPPAPRRSTLLGLALSRFRTGVTEQGLQGRWHHLMQLQPAWFARQGPPPARGVMVAYRHRSTLLATAASRACCRPPLHCFVALRPSSHPQLCRLQGPSLRDCSGGAPCMRPPHRGVAAITPQRVAASHGDKQHGYFVQGARSAGACSPTPVHPPSPQSTRPSHSLLQFSRACCSLFGRGDGSIHRVADNQTGWS